MKHRSLTAVAVLLLSLHGSAAAAADDHPPLAKAPFSTEQARAFQRQWARHTGKEPVHTNSIGMTLALLPPGEFTMGRTEEQLHRLLDTVKNHPEMKRNYGGQVVWSMLMMPAHRVRLTKPFYMGATEVTVGQFRQFTEASAYKTEAEQGLDGGEPYKANRPICTWRRPMVWINLQQKDDEPVLHLCYNDCVEFCKWLSAKEGVEYCLPTEAEWEYACRAGTTTPWSFGDFADVPRVAHEYAFWSEGLQGKHDRPRSVARGKPNAFGLYDMHGNVWEYVADWWHRMYYKESPLNDPAGPDTQDELNRLRRIIRGSSFDWDSWGGDAAYRMRIGQRSTQHPHMGFRVAMRLQGIRGVPPAVDPEEERRARRRDPGADSTQVLAALPAAAAKDRHPKELTLDLGSGVKMEFVLIPAGSVLMGSDHGLKDERPVHRVVISRPFYMAKYELTQSQWEAIMGKHPWLEELRKGKDDEAVGPNKAMDALSRTACQEFIGQLKAKVPGHAFALPTEAQWEYACRAGSSSEYHFGDDDKALGEYAWFYGNMNWVGHPGFRGKLFYHDVGLKKPNAFGLYDMHGGVWEWCADRYDPDCYLTSPLVDPQGPPKGVFGVLRGGSWFRYAKYARSAYRKFFHPDGDGDATTAYINDFGCRLVINLDVKPGEKPDAGRRGSPDPAGTTDRKVSETQTTPQDSGTPAVKPVARSGDRPQREARSGEQPQRTDPTQRAVNYTRLARSLVRYPHNPVIKAGEQGAWDDQTLGCFTVLHDGGKFYFYGDGTKYGKPKQIGMATSNDGMSWTKYDQNPLFPGSMPHAIKVGNAFRLYYPDAGGLQMRTSPDGFKWSEPRKVMEGHMDPCVVRVGENGFHLYYCDGGRKTADGQQVWEFKNFMATSPDGITWRKEPEPVLPLGPPGSWDSQSHAGPCVLRLEDGFHLWYLGSGPYQGKTAWRAGHATSPDGLKWTRSGLTPVFDIGPAGDWDGGTLMHFDVAFRDGQFRFWYAAAPTEHGDETKMTIQIGYGTSR
jgi:formylglycine-generating enzyme required for sulfatase activity